MSIRRGKEECTMHSAVALRDTSRTQRGRLVGLYSCGVKMFGDLASKSNIFLQLCPLPPHNVTPPALTLVLLFCSTLI